MFLCTFFILSCNLLHESTKTFSPFSAYFSPNDIIAEKDLAEASHSCYCMALHILSSLIPVEYDGEDKEHPPHRVGLPSSKDSYRGKCLDRHLEKPIEHRRENSTHRSTTQCRQLPHSLQRPQDGQSVVELRGKDNVHAVGQF